MSNNAGMGRGETRAPEAKGVLCPGGLTTFRKKPMELQEKRVEPGICEEKLSSEASMEHGLQGQQGCFRGGENLPKEKKTGEHFAAARANWRTHGAFT